MKPWLVYDDATGTFLGRILARPEDKEKSAASCWPRTEKFRIEPVEKTR